MLLLEGGRVICPATGLDQVLDLLVEDGQIVRLGGGSRPESAQVIDCRGAIVAPGLVDLGAELADPGETWREDLVSGSKAAAAGGFTTVVASPRTVPVVDEPGLARDILARASRLGGARIEQAGALTLGLRGEELSEIGLLAEAGCKAISDGRVAMSDSGVLRRALDYVRPFGLVVLLRPSDPWLEREGVMHEGQVSLRVGLRGVAAASEHIGVSRAIALARTTGARVHLTQVTTGVSVDLVEAARADGVDISLGVPARHLLLSDEDLEASDYDPSFRMLPPLRSVADRDALREAVRHGRVHCIQADHVPWSRVEKEVELDYAPDGAVGLETALRAALTALPDQLVAVLRAMSVEPGRRIGLDPRIAPGAVADLVVFAAEEELLVRPPRWSRGCNEPLLGMRLRGAVRHTLVGGRIT